MLKFKAAVFVLPFIVHVTETLSIVLPVAPFDRALLGQRQFGAAVSTQTVIVHVAIALCVGQTVTPSNRTCLGLPAIDFNCPFS